MYTSYVEGGSFDPTPVFATGKGVESPYGVVAEVEFNPLGLVNGPWMVRAPCEVGEVAAKVAGEWTCQPA